MPRTGHGNLQKQGTGTCATEPLACSTHLRYCLQLKLSLLRKRPGLAVRGARRTLRKLLTVQQELERHTLMAQRHVRVLREVQVQAHVHCTCNLMLYAAVQLH